MALSAGFQRIAHLVRPFPVRSSDGNAFVALDGTLLGIDRVGTTSGYDQAFYSGKHKCHGVNVQVIDNPAGRWVSPELHGARHGMRAAREHGIIDALDDARVTTIAETPTRAADQ